MVRLPVGAAQRIVLGAAIAAAVSACSVDPATVPGLTVTPANPCGSVSGTTFDLGVSSTTEGNFATFTTDGTGLWVNGSGWLHGNAFDPPSGEGHSGLYVGLASTPPMKDEQTGHLSNVVVESGVYEGRWTFLELPAGDYSILTGSWLDLQIQTCGEGAVSNVVPVPPHFAPGVTWTAVEPCDPSDGTVVALGSPRLQSDTWATLSTDGGEIWVTAQGYRHEKPLDPEVGTGAVYVGAAADKPTYKPGGGVPENLVDVKPLREGGWTLLELPAGDYWLTITDASDVVATSCDPAGIFNPSPAPSPAS